MISFDLFEKPVFPDVKNIRIPYQGSKNKIALQLFEKMLEIKPNAKYFYDIFGGGAAMSFTALQLGLKVYYNEKQKSMVDFVDYIINRIKSNKRGKYGLFPSDFYKFITRQEFEFLKNENSIKGQFARICYSFGNNQKGYVFGEDIEKEKHLAHNIIMFCCKKSLAELNSLKNTKFVLSNKKTWNERRLDFLLQITSQKRMENYSRILNNLVNLQQLEDFEKLRRIQNLERIEDLEQIQNLERIENFKITSLDFKDVIINTPQEETIIYLDPPYRGTAKYLEDAFFQDIDNYFINSPYTCFLSEYNAPFEPVLSINKRVLFSATNNSKIVIEKLFYNGK